MQMLTSTIIPTIGRPALSRAVHSVLEQNFRHGDFEVIVVNDSGNPLPLEDWQTDARVQLIQTNHRNRSVARNAGAASAKGKYLHFLDDDDWMLLDAFENLWGVAQQFPHAGWVYGGVRLVDQEGNLLVEIAPDFRGNCFNPVMAFEWIPLQGSLIRSEAFFTGGGFVDLHFLGGGCEDIHLERIIASAHDFACTQNMVTVVRVGEQGSSTQWNSLFNQNRLSRELTLDIPGAFSRMRASAKTITSRSAYWYGRIVYCYLASFRWNLNLKRVFKSLSRGMFAIAGFLVAGANIFVPDFWLGAARPHNNLLGNSLQSFISQLYDTSKWKQ